MWRTKEGDVPALDAKLGIYGVEPIKIPPGLAKTFMLKQIVLVSYEGKKLTCNQDCIQIPISSLTEYLLFWS